MTEQTAVLEPVDNDGPPCPHCGAEQDWEECDTCGGDGETAYGELHSQDPLWYDEEDTEPCPDCDGAGGYWWCYFCREASRREAMDREVANG